jgi:hypothetical protein
MPQDHTFYLWDDTDEVTSDLCGACGGSKSEHEDDRSWELTQDLSTTPF